MVKPQEEPFKDLTSLLLGKMIYKGNDISAFNEKDLREFRKEVQIIFQDPYSSLNPRMTIGNAIMEPMQVHGILANDEERKKRELKSY